MEMHLVLFFFSALLFECGFADPLVTLGDGTKIQGKDEGGVSYFKGIPYAQPPINNLRWAPPVPWVNPDVSIVLNASTHGHNCMQFLWYA
jgi:para-nitrobenzyl esterase